MTDTFTWTSIPTVHHLSFGKDNHDEAFSNGPTEQSASVPTRSTSSALAQPVGLVLDARWHPPLIMGCYHPVTVGIKRKPAYLDGPRILDDQEVPCGKCLGCRTEQARQWAVRLFHEGQVTKPAWFVTLTYNDEEMPANGSLAPRDTQLFWKRLRKAFPDQSIRYYLCGEYGETTQRPHYHAVLLGARFPDMSHLRGGGSDRVWTSGTLTDLWSHGLTEFSAVTWASASYVTGYVRKKVLQSQDPDHYTRYDPETGELVDLVPEFARMSRRPAIGLRWLQKYWEDVYPRDHVTVNGVKMKPPRYYDRAFEDERHTFPGITLKERRQLLYEVKYNRWDPDLEVTPEILANRETNHEARTALFKARDGV